MKDFVISESTLLAYDGKEENVEIPKEVTKIANGAFKDNDYIKSVKIGDQVSQIMDGAFQNCTNLESVIIDAKIESLPWYCFSSCTSLKSVALPSTLKEIGTEAFAKCNSLVEFEIPEGVEKLEFGAFRECESLERIKIPKSLKTMETGAFSCCFKLLKVDFANRDLWKIRRAEIFKRAFDGAVRDVIALESFDKESPLTKLIIKNIVVTVDNLIEIGRIDLLVKLLEYKSQMSEQTFDQLLDVAQKHKSTEAIAILLEYKNNLK